MNNLKKFYPKLKPFLPLLILLFFTIILITLGPIFSSYQPDQFDFRSRLLEPSDTHFLGTDHLGRDVLSRLLHGASYSLGLAMLISLFTGLIGTITGMLSGVIGGWFDYGTMRITEVFLAFPELIAAVVVAGILGPSLTNMIIALVSVGWMRYARLIRGICLSVSKRDYVTQAKLFGVPFPIIMWRHFLPSLIPSLIVVWTVGWARTILAISGLGFLGFGIQPPEPEWGTMILDGKPYLFTQPYLMVFPGILVFLFVLAINLVGDKLRDNMRVTS